MKCLKQALVESCTIMLGVYSSSREGSINRDLMAEAGGVNLYGYISNNPAEERRFRKSRDISDPTDDMVSVERGPEQRRHKLLVVASARTNQWPYPRTTSGARHPAHTRQ